MNTDSESLEIEVKFFIKNPEEIKKLLFQMGATGSQKVFESNLRYEDKDRNLKRNGQLLRLRQDNACRLTFKSRPGFEDSGFKVFHELEVQVDNCDKMDAILQSLGYHAVQVYEKWRETFILGQTHICLDSLPFGLFLEIEGSRLDIKTIADHLELPWSQRITKNYLALFDIIRHERKLDFTDVTFSNFEGRNIDLETFLPLFFTENT